MLLTVKRPLLIVSRRLKQRKRVLLPQPDEPITAVTSPLLIAPVTPWRTFKEPKFFSRFSKAIAFSILYSEINFGF